MTSRNQPRRRQPRRRHALRPVAEGLEQRIALSAEVGVSLDQNSIYGLNPIWTDLHNLASPWKPLSGSSSVPLTADGYPLINAQTYFSVANYPGGNYQFSYTGGGSVSFSGAGVLAGPVNVAGGVTTGTVAVSHSMGDGVTLSMRVTGVSSSNPMDNFHLMMPGYGDGTTAEPMFTPAFLQSLRPFSNIRFMNWGQTNNSTLANWQDRVGPNAFLTDGPGGVPYEDMIELCNETGKDMWINIPALATPQFVQSLAQLISARLDPGLNVYFEYGNEDWNGGFAAYGQIAKAALANPVLDHSLSQYQLVAQQSAYSLVTDGQIFDQVFGAASSRVRPIFGAQASWTPFEQYGLAFIQQQFGPPSQYIYAAAVAPYIGEVGKITSGTTLATLFADMNSYINTKYVPYITADIALANQYGVPLVAYEGGQSLSAGTSSGPIFNLMNQAQSDPRMYQIYTQMMSDWQQAGGQLFDAYQLSGIAGWWGFWGMLPNVTAAGSQAYDGLVSTIVPAGDANADGVVDYADFQALQANYGQGTMTYRSQGDFNHDGTTNWSDLNILRQNLTPSGFTVAQFAQQAVFGQPATVDSPTALEYDGYGVTFASSLPFASSSGNVQLNQNSAGGPIVLGGATYSEGLGVTANSSATIALNGGYSRFDSTIGVDSSGSTASSVIFELYGDSSLLYQSPVMAYGAAAVPIDVNVAGVQQLQLVMVPAPGSVAGNDHGVWGDARLISTANFGATPPYTLTWQVSQNGQVLSTQTADSFAFAALQGSYTITVTVTDAQGDTATASTGVTMVLGVGTASYLMKDSMNKGNWVGTYGTQGYSVAGNATSLPTYATLTTSGASVYTWVDSTSNSRGLETAAGAGALAAAWYGTGFSMNLNLSDGQQHLLTIYAVDWDKLRRSEQIQLVDATTGNVLDSRVLSSFSGGAYLQWTVGGNLVIKVTSLAGPNAVISGLFLDAPPAVLRPLVQADGTTQGNWIGTYGGQGYAIDGASASLPSYASVNVVGAASWTWAASTTDVRGLQDPSGSGRTAAGWYGGSFTIDVNLADGLSHLLALYAVDWPNQGRNEQIQILDAASGSILDTETISSFSGGVYLQWSVKGDVIVQVTSLAGPNAVISGLFLDQPLTFVSATASLVRTDTTTQGNWIGTYGGQGYAIDGAAASLPSYASVNVVGAASWTWAASTTDARGLERPSGSGRTALGWYGSSFTIDVNLADGQTHPLALYAVDWPDQGRNEQIQILDATSGNVLDTETISSFSGGVYLEWAISGDVFIKVTSLAGPNAVISGLFLDPSGSATASLVRTDAATQGNWIGTYGSQGYAIDGVAASLPSYASVNVVGAASWTWAASTTDVRGLQDPSGSGRTALGWYGNRFSIGVNLTDGQTHPLALYAVDWANQGRQEQIQIVSAATGAVLDTQTLSSFGSGVYLVWAVKGDVIIQVTSLAGPNAVISGLFLGSSLPSILSIASLARTDAATRGNWIGAYGSQGYAIDGAAASLPSYASVNVVGAASWTWAASTTDARGLEQPSGSGRTALGWYGSSFAIDVNLTDGQLHLLSLYAVDWANQGRQEQIQIVSAATGAVLDTQTLSSFGGGVYLSWAVSGDVIVQVTSLAGPNAVISGLFLDPPLTSVLSAASLVRTDTTTRGNWIGAYGSQGYAIDGAAASLPSYASVNVVGAASWTWAASTTDARGLERPSGSGRTALGWYGSSFAIDVNLTDGLPHLLSLYAVDWANQGRQEQIQIVSAATGAVLDTQTLSSFGGGVYLSWALKGDVIIQITGLAGPNAVISGLFLDPP